MLLNAGCGDHHPDGWVNLDIDGSCRPDMVSDAQAMPYDSGSVERIFCSHVLEHLSYHAVLPAVLEEFARVLEPGAGELFVLGPDIERAVLEGEPRQLLEAIVAWPSGYTQGYQCKKPPIGHAWTMTGLFTEAALAEAGFEVQSYSGRLHKAAAEGWPLGNMGDWQLGYRCVVA